jgi:general L-amino acid transport system ATP-binding protein
MGQAMQISDEVMISMDAVHKWYGQFHVLKDINLTVHKGERIVICGPSGSGKSTLIRCINRLEEHQRGKIVVDKVELGNDVKNIELVRREVGMVFQHFNLFPHLTVLENLTLAPIWVRKLPRAQAEEAAMLYLKRVKIPEQAKKYPGQLSGGQQQRVALARALVLKPEVLLLDEPLGALDLKLRKAMRYELKRLQRTTGITTIYVTHDQEEAMSMSDKVVVLNRGRIEQVGRPEEIYRTPRSAFVGDFIGESNLLPATVDETLPAGRIRVRCVGFPGTATARSAESGRRIGVGDLVTLLVRAERVALAAAPHGDGNWFAGEVVERSFLGATSRLYLKVVGSDQLVIADLAGTLPEWAAVLARVHFGWSEDDALAYAPGDVPPEDHQT